MRRRGEAGRRGGGVPGRARIGVTSGINESETAGLEAERCVPETATHARQPTGYASQPTACASQPSHDAS